MAGPVVPPRLASAHEAQSLVALVEAAYAPWVAVIGRRPMPMDDDYATRIAAGQAWVQEQDGALIGLLVLEDAKDAVLIDNLAVAPAVQGQGVGRTLISFAESEARRRGHAVLRLYTHALMSTNIALYGRLGFVEMERRQERGFDRIYREKWLA